MSKQRDPYPKPCLLIVDRGERRAGLPLRDVYLIHGHGGAEGTMLYQCGISQGEAEQFAEWFAVRGVSCERRADAGVPKQGLFE